MYLYILGCGDLSHFWRVIHRFSGFSGSLWTLWGDYRGVVSLEQRNNVELFLLYSLDSTLVLSLSVLDCWVGLGAIPPGVGLSLRSAAR